MVVIHTIHRLADDLQEDARTFMPRAAKAVRGVAVDGQRFAARDAKGTARRHGKLYPRSITAEPLRPLTWEWGPDSSLPQGGMDFEHGSGRQTRPHKNVAKGADRHGAPDLARRIGGNVMPATFYG